MGASFIDLPFKLIFRVLSLVSDDIHTTKSILSIKKVRHKLRRHVKVVLDFKWKEPVFFPFHDELEVVRTTDLKDHPRDKYLYLVEIDMAQKSYHADKFYPDERGVYSGLKEVLEGYSGPKVFLCISIASPLHKWPQDLHMFEPKASFIELFKSCQFRGVHVKLSDNQLTYGTQTLWWASSAFKISYDGALSPELDYFFKNSKMEDQSMPELRCSSSVVQSRFLEIASAGHSRFIFSMTPSPDWKLPPGELLQIYHYLSNIGNQQWVNCQGAKFEGINTFKNFSLEMSHGPIPHHEVLNFAYLKWDLELVMRTSTGIAGRARKETKPQIDGLHSKSLSSLSVASLDSDCPSFSNINLSNLTAFKLQYKEPEPEKHPQTFILNELRRSPIQYLSVPTYQTLKQCCLTTNLSYLEGISIYDDFELDDFNKLLFPHLKSLVISTQVRGNIKAKAPKLESLSWTSKAEVLWDLYLLRGYTRLNTLKLEALDFRHLGHAQFPEVRNLKIFYSRSPLREAGNDRGNIAEDGIWLPLSAPKLETFTFIFDSSRTRDHTSLNLKSYPMLKVVTFGNVQKLEVQSCPNLVKLEETRDCLNDLSSLTCFVELPSLRFISYKSFDSVKITLGADMSPVFIKRVHRRRESENVRYSFWGFSYPPESYEAYQGSETAKWNRKMGSIGSILAIYGGAVDGLEEWLGS